MRKNIVDFDTIPRKRLYGKKATPKEFLNEIMRLRNYGVLQRKVPMPWGEVARKVGMKRTRVYDYRDMAIKLGMINVDEKNREIVSEQVKQIQEYVFLEKNEFAKELLVMEWVEDLRSRRNGMPIKSWKTLLSSLRFLCNKCRINPDQLIIDRKTTEKIVRNFAEMYKTGEIQVSSRTKINFESSAEFAIHSRVMAVRSFCGFHGMSWPRGTASIMSGKVVGHGKYSHIRFTTEEIEIADEFIKKRWGIDSDVFRMFWVGVESCSRKTALINMNCNWIKKENKNKGTTIFVMKATESKTNYIKNGQWLKYITRSDTQQSLELLKARKGEGSRIIEDYFDKSVRVQELRENLREIYRHVGKSEDYFYTNPFHALRHIGAHYWLEKTNYNYGMIAKMGGWHTIDELKNSYGEMSPEFVIEKIELWT